METGCGVFHSTVPHNLLSMYILVRVVDWCWLRCTFLDEKYEGNEGFACYNFPLKVVYRSYFQLYIICQMVSL